MGKVSEGLRRDFRGGKLGKVQKIVEELNREAERALEEAKITALGIVLEEENYEEIVRAKRVVKELYALWKANKGAAKLIWGLLGTPDTVDEPSRSVNNGLEKGV